MRASELEREDKGEGRFFFLLTKKTKNPKKPQNKKPALFIEAAKGAPDAAAAGSSPDVALPTVSLLVHLAATQPHYGGGGSNAQMDARAFAHVVKVPGLAAAAARLRARGAAPALAALLRLLLAPLVEASGSNARHRQVLVEFARSGALSDGSGSGDSEGADVLSSRLARTAADGVIAAGAAATSSGGEAGGEATRDFAAALAALDSRAPLAVGAAVDAALAPLREERRKKKRSSEGKEEAGGEQGEDGGERAAASAALEFISAALSDARNAPVAAAGASLDLHRFLARQANSNAIP